MPRLDCPSAETLNPKVAVEAGSLEQDVVAASPQSASQNEDQLLQV